jgi:hypothetical protein
MRLRINLEWAFESLLHNLQHRLMQRLKPNISAWAEETLPLLRMRLMASTDGDAVGKARGCLGFQRADL